MTEWLMAVVTKPEVFAATMAALAALFTVIATFRAPMKAAHFADQLRREGEMSQDRRRIKMAVFTTIVQERVGLWSPDAVRALNLIEVAFYDVREVRECWVALYETFDATKKIPEHVQKERLRALLTAMAKDLGLGGALGMADFERVYYPVSIEQEQKLRMLEREASIRRLQGLDSPEANTSGMVANTVWPPRPLP